MMWNSEADTHTTCLKVEDKHIRKILLSMNEVMDSALLFCIAAHIVKLQDEVQDFVEMEAGASL